MSKDEEIMDSLKINIPIVKTKTFWERFIGFMFKKSASYALLFNNCRYIHTFFMRFDLDIVYLDKDNRIVKVVKSLKPFKMAFPAKTTVSILEIPSNISNIKLSAAGKKLDVS
jgi:uncharacterized membrane protein (UPF0127 family)